MSTRAVVRTMKSQPVSDGAGVKLRRSLGMAGIRCDPFLMLDEFRSDNPEDYIAGFPDHPHRGFETVTYMLAGSMQHRDSMGNTGNLRPGSVQWMTAGSGIIHSEMPQQENGLMWGFQLWVNLPAEKKMTAPRYQDIPPDAIPEVQQDEATVRVVAGSYAGAQGPIAGVDAEPTYLDVTLAADRGWEIASDSSHNVFVYPFDGAKISIGQGSDEVFIEPHELALLGPGDRIAIRSVGGQSRFLVVSGKPFNEPIVQYGPFVMSTEAEVQQAFSDFRSGKLVQTKAEMT